MDKHISTWCFLSEMLATVGTRAFIVNTRKTVLKKPSVVSHFSFQGSLFRGPSLKDRRVKYGLLPALHGLSIVKFNREKTQKIYFSFCNSMATPLRVVMLLKQHHVSWCHTEVRVGAPLIIAPGCGLIGLFFWSWIHSASVYWSMIIRAWHSRPQSHTNMVWRQRAKQHRDLTIRRVDIVT